MSDEREKNPNAELRDHQPPAGRNVAPDEAEAAGERATADQPVTKEEIEEQASYKGHETDVAQQAGESEHEP